jgi:tetratricopeptide (TPR) repeat protein
MESQPPIFVDVQTILAFSRVRPRVGWVLYLLGGAMFVIIIAAIMGDRLGIPQDTLEALATVLMVAMLGSISVYNFIYNRACRAEQAQVEAAEELVQLRRWPQAALLLQSLLARPSRVPMARLQGLVYYTTVLGRFQRFDDVLAICDHLLELVPPDAPIVHLIKLARGGALLRQDRLFDADRVISDLRRGSGAAESGGLALLELYRDVKTGHPNEGLEIFKKKLELIRQQFGHRVANAYVLAAKAYDMLNQPDQARSAYREATLLAPPMELNMRYPEVADLAARYGTSPAPVEVAG